MRNVDLRYIAAVLIALFVLIQFIRPDRTNPPVDPNATFEAIAKPNAQVKSVVSRSCADCHSNTTAWPWYSNVAPVSWLVASDVQRGRSKLNFSEWSRLDPQLAAKRLKKACSEMKEGGMPLPVYTLLHRESKLSASEVEAFCAVADSQR